MSCKIYWSPTTRYAWGKFASETSSLPTVGTRTSIHGYNPHFVLCTIGINSDFFLLQGHQSPKYLTSNTPLWPASTNLAMRALSILSFIRDHDRPRSMKHDKLFICSYRRGRMHTLTSSCISQCWIGDGRVMSPGNEAGACTTFVKDNCNNRTDKQDRQRHGNTV